MAIYANDLSGLSAAAVADYEAKTRRTGLNQNFLAALAAERNRRALGEGQIGAENYRTGATREVGMGQVGVGQGNVAARNREIDNILTAAKMRDELERKRLEQQGGQFYDSLNAQERMLQQQLEAQRAYDLNLSSLGGIMPTSPSVYNAMREEAALAAEDQASAEQAASELNMALPGIIKSSTSWGGWGSPDNQKVSEAIQARLAALLPDLPSRARIAIDPKTFTASVKPSAYTPQDPGAPPIDPSVARQILASPAARRRFNLGGLSLDPTAILNRRSVRPATTPAEITPQYDTGRMYLNVGGY